jgi:hypothetical protein
MRAQSAWFWPPCSPAKWRAMGTLSRGGQTGASGQLPRLSGEVQTMHQRPHNTCVRHGPSPRCRLGAPQPPAAKCGKSAARRATRDARRATGRGYAARFLQLHVPARASHRRGRGVGLEKGGSVPSVHAQLVSTEHGARWTRVYRWMDAATHRTWRPWQGHHTGREQLIWELPPAVVLSYEQDSRSAREPSAPALATILNGFTLTFPDLAGSTDPLL